jgi:hypothetical protein
MPATLWTIRIACLLYAAALACWIARRRHPGDVRLSIRRRSAARILWTAAFLAYAAHVVAAFALVHHWSHGEAYRATAQETAAMFGWNWGGGLYFNYAFTAVWAIDVVWIWNAPSYARRPVWIDKTIHTFIAFMFFNGAIVFAHGATRWISLAGALALLLGFLRMRHFDRKK